MYNKKVQIALGIVVSGLILVSVAFAVLSQNLNISFGNVTQSALTWNVGFKGSESVPTKEGTSDDGLSCGNATVTPSTVTISNSTLSKPEDKCTYPLSIINSGDIAATLTNIAATAPTSVNCDISGSTMICGNITYKLVTTSDTSLTTGITINKNEEYNIELVVSYTGTSLTTAQVTQNNAKFTLTYTQSSNRSGDIPEGVEEVKQPKCKRATILHTENCIKNSKDDYCSGVGYTESGSKGTRTITYGNLGTTGILSAGDAFDCDVNGDGTYDPTTERFYYLSGIDGDDTSDYAALIYYSNVSSGVPENTYFSVLYGVDKKNQDGPTVAYQELPSTTQWPNVKLSNNGKRQIYNTKGTTTVDEYEYDSSWNIINTTTYNLPVFEYKNKAARMISAKEITKVCGIEIGAPTGGQLDSCEFLLERTGFSDDYQTISYFIESPPPDSNETQRYVDGFARSIGGVSGQAKVRPVIEVLKTDIEY